MNGELWHHGILGMKWGVRRYQNEDGSYTKEGLKRYRQAEVKYQEADQKYKEAKASGKDARAEKAERKVAKRDLNKK